MNNFISKNCMDIKNNSQISYDDLYAYQKKCETEREAQPVK